MNIINSTIVLTLFAALPAFGQSTNLQIISTTVGDERSISIKWQSESNAVYQIEYASELVHSNTAWTVLYEDYPSHGTNTFWLDTGDYSQIPALPYPRRAPMRFYRVAMAGTNTAPIPWVQITAPANNSVASGEMMVSVVGTSSLPFVIHKLFVDGQEMKPSEDGTNYLINTPEWSNGPHILFATAKTQAALETTHGDRNMGYGRAVSAYVTVVFSNYISQLSFLEPFFSAGLGPDPASQCGFLSLLGLDAPNT